MNHKPLDAKLPGRYGKMTRAQMDALVGDLDRPIPLSETRAMTAAERPPVAAGQTPPRDGPAVEWASE